MPYLSFCCQLPISLFPRYRRSAELQWRRQWATQLPGNGRGGWGAQGSRAVAVVPRAVAVSPSPSLSPSYTNTITYYYHYYLHIFYCCCSILARHQGTCGRYRLSCYGGGAHVFLRGEKGAVGLVIARRERQAQQVGEYAAGGA